MGPRVWLSSSMSRLTLMSHLGHSFATPVPYPVVQLPVDKHHRASVLFVMPGQVHRCFLPAKYSVRASFVCCPVRPTVRFVRCETIIKLDSHRGVVVENW